MPTAQGGRTRSCSSSISRASCCTACTSRVVIPLYPRDAVPRPLDVLNPVFVVNGAEVVLVTQEMAAVPPAALGPRVGSLAAERDAIIRAIDMLLSGI